MDTNINYNKLISSNKCLIKSYLIVQILKLKKDSVGLFDEQAAILNSLGLKISMKLIDLCTGLNDRQKTRINSNCTSLAGDNDDLKRIFSNLNHYVEKELNPIESKEIFAQLFKLSNSLETNFMFEETAEQSPKRFGYFLTPFFKYMHKFIEKRNEALNRNLAAFFSIKQTSQAHEDINKDLNKILLKILNSFFQNACAELNTHQKSLLYDRGLTEATNTYLDELESLLKKIVSIERMMSENSLVPSSLVNRFVKSRSCLSIAQQNYRRIKRKYSNLELNSSCNKKASCHDSAMSVSSSFFFRNKRIRRISESCCSVNESLSSPNMKRRLESALFQPLNKVPGIGRIYAKRLSQHNMSLFGDLIHMYRVECNLNDALFQHKLKKIASIRFDSIQKITRIIHNYLDQQ